MTIEFNGKTYEVTGKKLARLIPGWLAWYGEAKIFSTFTDAVAGMMQPGLKRSFVKACGRLGALSIGYGAKLATDILVVDFLKFHEERKEAEANG